MQFTTQQNLAATIEACDQPVSPRNYANLLKTLSQCEAKRLGYPIMGNIEHIIQTSGDEDANKALNKLKDLCPNNAGSPYKLCYPLSTKLVEQELISMLSNYFGFPQGSTKGYIAAGSSEGNLACLNLLKNKLIATGKEKILRLKQIKNDLHRQLDKAKEQQHLEAYCQINEALQKTENEIKLIKRPVLYISDQAHASIGKAAKIIGLKLKTVASLSSGSMSLGDLQEKIRSHMQVSPLTPIIVSATIGTTVLGATDPIPDIYRILTEEVQKKGGNFKIHADGAYLGATLPIDKPFGDENILAYTDTFVCSGHKCFGVKTPCSVMLAKNEIINKFKPIPGADKAAYLDLSEDFTMSCSRSGSTVVEWYDMALKLGLNQENYPKMRELIQYCHNLTGYFYQELIKVVREESIIFNPNQFNIRFPLPEDKEIARQLKREFVLMPADQADKFASVCILGHVTKQQIDAFMSVYAQYMRNTKETEAKLSSDYGIFDANALKNSLQPAPTQGNSVVQSNAEPVVNVEHKF